MNFKINWLLIIFLVGACLPAQTLVVGASGGDLIFDPAAVFSGDSAIYNANIYETLVNYDYEKQKVTPCLAKSWKMFENGKKWLFTLRDDVKFHDGTKLNADSVVFSFLRQFNADFSYRFYEFILFKEIFPNLLDVKKIAEDQVLFELSHPYPAFLKALTTDSAAIVSAEAVKKHGPDFIKNPSGTGPYLCGQYQQNKVLILERNPHYWGETPYYKKVIVEFDKNFEYQVENLKSERTHLLLFYSISKLVGIRKINWIKIDVKPVYSLTYCAFNLEHPLLKNESLRKALVYLWDERILTQVFQNFVSPLHLLVPQDLLKDYSLNQNRYSLENARKELKKTDWKAGDKLEILLPQSSEGTLITDMLRYYIQRAGQVGLNLKIKYVKTEDFEQRIKNRDYQLTVSGWIADWPDAENFLSAHFSPDLLKKGHPNLYAEYLKDLISLVEQSKKELVEEKRLEIFKKIVAEINRRALAIPLFQDLQVFIYNQKIGNLVADPLQRVFFSRIKK